MQIRLLNPWASIWFRPKETMQAILSTECQRSVFLLVFLSALVSAIETNNLRYALPSPVSIVCLLGGVFVGWLIGLIIVFLCAELLEWTGKWLGGQGKNEDIRLAIVWPSVIAFSSIFVLILLRVVSITYVKGAFSEFFVWMEYAMELWAFVVYLICLGEIQKFSIWKALLNTLLPIVIIGGVGLFLVAAGYSAYYHRIGLPFIK